jgi:hypothetical protein
MEKQKQYQYRKVPQRILPRAHKLPENNNNNNNNNNNLQKNITIKLDRHKVEEKVNLVKIQTVQAFDAKEKDKESEKEKKHAAMKLGAGFMGSVFSPPLPCQNVDLEKMVREISKTTPLVLKHTELAMGLTAVHTGNYIRERWLKLKHQPYHVGISLAVWKLLGLIRSGEADDYFVLPLPQVCSNCLTPDGSQSLNPTGAMVGIYMKNAGKKWDDVLPPASAFTKREAGIAAHIIAAVLLLHGLGITHNDIRRANITIDDKSIPRLIDWELRTRQRDQAFATYHQQQPQKEKEKNEKHHSKNLEKEDDIFDEEDDATLYMDVIASDRRWYQMIVHGPFSTAKDLVQLDWIKLGRVFERTWPENKVSMHPEKYAKLITQVKKLLRQGSDRDAILAWTILTHSS